MKVILRKNEDWLDVQKELLKIAPTLSEKPYVCEIKPFKKTRSLDSNAYFHVLVDKIAKVVGKSAEEVKVQMVFDYGTIASDDEGLKVGFKALKSIPITRYFKYAKPIGECEENGKTFVKYIIYKETHTLNTTEMARLINGVIEEAKTLGIETLTPAELEVLKGYEKEKNYENFQKQD